MKQTSNLPAQIRKFLKASNFHSESYFWSKSELSTFLRGRREHKGLRGERRRVRGKSETSKVRRIPKIRQVILKLQYFSCQAPLSMGYIRQEYRSGLPFPSPGDLLDPGVEPGSPVLQVVSYTVARLFPS